jgi:hypothetical protein
MGKHIIKILVAITIIALLITGGLSLLLPFSSGGSELVTLNMANTVSPIIGKLGEIACNYENIQIHNDPDTGPSISSGMMCQCKEGK